MLAQLSFALAEPARAVAAARGADMSGVVVPHSTQPSTSAPCSCCCCCLINTAAAAELCINDFREC
jgi:hypothetical protein